MGWSAHSGAEVADKMVQNSGCVVNNVQKAWGQPVKEKPSGPPAFDVQTHRQTRGEEVWGRSQETAAGKEARVQVKDGQGQGPQLRLSLPECEFPPGPSQTI